VNNSIRVKFIEIALQAPPLIAVQVQEADDLSKSESAVSELTDEAKNSILLGLGKQAASIRILSHDDREPPARMILLQSQLMRPDLAVTPRSRREPFPWLALAGIVGLWIMVAFQVPAASGATLPGITLPACPLRSLTGLRCPFCGLTTGCAWMAHGHFIAAWNSNILSPWLMLGTLAAAFYLVVLRLGAGYKITLTVSKEWAAWIPRLGAGCLVLSWIVNLLRS
jgi:hypothetical protein